MLGAFDLFDTRAGRHVTLPVRNVNAIVFVGGGAVLVHGTDGESGPGTLFLIAADGSVVTSVTEPAGLPAGSSFLGYVPSPS